MNLYWVQILSFTFLTIKAYTKEICPNQHNAEGKNIMEKYF